MAAGARALHLPGRSAPFHRSISRPHQPPAPPPQYVGTEECIWAIIHKRFPHLFKSSSNNSQGNHGDNCNSFSLSKQEEAKTLLPLARKKKLATPLKL